jgi:hypothetical protein
VKKVFRCDDCYEADPPMFMLKNDLWLRLTGGDPRKILCFDCAEKRLGRKIRWDDLRNCIFKKDMELAVRIWKQSEA